MTESIISNEKYKQMLKNYRKRKNIEPVTIKYLFIILILY